MRLTVRPLVGAVVVLLALAVAAPGISPAAAAPSLGGAADPNPPQSSTEATIVDMVNTSGLYGGTVSSATATTPYPSTGLQNQRSVSTAQIVLDAPEIAPGSELLTYCADLDAETTVGTHYELGVWTDVANQPYVQWILQNYYPKVPAQPVAGTDAERVRAVQGAIWFFTDQFVVSPYYPAERNAVRAIVEAAQAAVDPTPAPPVLPTLTVDLQPDVPLQPGAPYGAYVVGGTAASSTIALDPGTEVYTDAAGTQPVVDGDTVAQGTSLYMRYRPADGRQAFTLTSLQTVPAGNAFVYDGGNPPRTTAQTLVLAADAQVPVRATAVLDPSDAGTVEVTAVVAGLAAGDQSQIDLGVGCTLGSWTETFAAFVPAGTDAGTAVVARLTGLLAGASCTLTQTADGANSYATLASSVVSQNPVIVPAAGTASITLTNTYDLPVPPTGILAIAVAIQGPAAGAQGTLALTATCVDPASATFQRDVTVPAGLTGTTVVAAFGTLPPGVVCSVAQTVDGRSADAEVTGTTILPATAVIAAGTTATITVTNTYQAPVPPSPGPSPSPTSSPTVAPTPDPASPSASPGVLPATGPAGALPWGIPIAVIAAGAALVGIAEVRRRRATRRDTAD